MRTRSWSNEKKRGEYRGKQKEGRSENGELEKEEGWVENGPLEAEIQDSAF